MKRIINVEMKSSSCCEVTGYQEYNQLLLVIDSNQ